MTRDLMAAQIPGMLQNLVRQETTKIHVPSPSFKIAQKIKHCFFLHNGVPHNLVRQEKAKIHVLSSVLKTLQNKKTSKNATYE